METMRKYEKPMTKTLLSFLGIDSVQSSPAPGAPFGEGTRKVLDAFLSLTSSIGMKTKDLEGYSAYAEIGEGELLGIPLHLDTVPFGADWSASPLGEVREEEGETVIYGRGAEDDKGPFVAVFYALKALLDEGRKPRRRIRIIAGVNEESGWKCIERYLKTEEIPSLSFSPDADFPVIHCEKGVCHARVTFKKPSEIDFIRGGERVNMVADRAELKMKTMSDGTLSKCMKGLAKIKFQEDGFLLSATGVSAHGSTPDKGENAILKLLYAAKSSNEFIADLYDAFFKTDGSGLGLQMSDEESGALTMNLGYAETTEDEISFGLDIRYPVSKKEEEILSAVKKALPGAFVSVTGRHAPLFVPKDSELVRSLTDAYNEVTNEGASPIAIGGATYARAFPNAVAFGPVFPGEESHIHQKDECIKLSNFVKCAEIYKKALEKLAF